MPNPPNKLKLRHWNQPQVKEFARRIRTRYRDAWDFFVPDIRTSVVDSFVLGIIRSQAADQINREAIEELWLAMHLEMRTGEVDVFAFQVKDPDAD